MFQRKQVSLICVLGSLATSGCCACNRSKQVMAFLLCFSHCKAIPEPSPCDGYTASYLFMANLSQFVLLEASTFTNTLRGERMPETRQ